MKVFALTFGRPTNASSRYRIYQYVEPLRAHGITLHAAEARSFTNWLDLRDYDLVLLQKQLLGWRKFSLLRRHSRDLAYDLDDAIWLPQKGKHHFFTQVRLWVRIRAQVRTVRFCITANEVLASHARQEGAARVDILPMALPAHDWPAPVPKTPRPEVILGWSGAPPNLPYLQHLEPALREVLRQCPNARLHIYCGKKPAFKNLPHRHFPFQPGTEAGVIRDFDIGLLPLPDDPFAAAKSPIKALQYFACGLPCVANPVGATRELVRKDLNGLWAKTTEEWVEALSALVKNQDRRLEMGAAARHFFEEHHTVESLTPRFAEVLRRSRSNQAP